MVTLAVLSILAAVSSTATALDNSTHAATLYFPTDSNAAYLSWLEQRGVGYGSSVFLSSRESEADSDNNGAAIHWQIDQDASKIRLAVAARATGWVGFGIAEAGGMPGSDIVYYTAATHTITDAYADAYLAPKVDVTQDWTLVHSQTEGGYIIFEAERDIDTDDPQDRPIIFDGRVERNPHRVIAAWGDSETIGYHGDSSARSTIRFYPTRHGSADGGLTSAGSEAQMFASAMAIEAEGYIDLIANDFIIPAVETEYADLCFSYQELVDQGMPTDKPLHVIGFEPIIGSKKHLHHITMYGLSDPNLRAPEGSCAERGFMGMSMVWGWAPGSHPHELPEEAGLPLGKDGNAFFWLNLHYDNRWLDEGVSDSSGVRLYYTSVRRENDMGVLQLGDPVVLLDGTQVGDGFSRHDFTCPESCLEGSFAADEVTVFSEHLHMHETGTKMVNKHVRNGEVIREARVDYFDFPQQGSYEVIQDRFTVKKGDSFHTECFFDTAEAEEGDAVKYGYGSKDEMCIAFLWYWPKQPIMLGVCGFGWFNPTCKAEYKSEALVAVDRAFGQLPVEEPGDALSSMPEVASSSQDEEQEPNKEDAGATSFGLALVPFNVLSLAAASLSLLFL